MKKYLIILIVLILVIVSILFVVLNNRKNIETNESENQIQVYETDEGYEIYNKNTNEKITNVTNEYEIKIYQDNPDYNPNP